MSSTSRRTGRPQSWSTALFCLLAVASSAHAAGAPPSSGPLKSSLDRIVARPAFAHALWGIEVRDLRKGELLYALNEDVSLAPASTLKLATTAAALDAYGPDATFSTTVESAARMDGMGRLVGDVYLVGRGDPMLYGSYAEAPETALDRLANAVVLAGVKRIEGRLIGHEAAFTGDRRAVDWGWGDLMWYYGADASALVFNNSAVHLKVTPGERIGEPVMLDRNPLSAYYQVVVTATTSASSSEAALVIDRPLGGNVIQVGGTFPQGAPAENLFVSIENPARFAATILAETLEARGVRVRGPIETSREPLPPGTRALAAVASPPLAEIVRQINQPSHNQRAEMLLRLVGLKVRGEGSPQAGLAAVGDFLTRLGVPQEGWALRDGCGLADTNLVTARGLVALLGGMHRHPQAEAFEKSLPLAGSEGTLKRRFQGTRVEGRVRAKSGSIRHTYALAGHATGRRGEPIAFAILLNHYPGDSALAQAALHDIVDALVTR